MAGRSTCTSRGVAGTSLGSVECLRVGSGLLGRVDGEGLPDGEGTVLGVGQPTGGVDRPGMGVGSSSGAVWVVGACHVGVGGGVHSRGARGRPTLVRLGEGTGLVVAAFAGLVERAAVDGTGAGTGAGAVRRGAGAVGSAETVGVAARRGVGVSCLIDSGIGRADLLVAGLSGLGVLVGEVSGPGWLTCPWGATVFTMAEVATAARKRTEPLFATLIGCCQCCGSSFSTSESATRTGNGRFVPTVSES